VRAVATTTPPPWWDEVVVRNNAATVYQATPWATYLAALAGAKPVYLYVEDKKEIIATLLLAKKPYLAEMFGNLKLHLLPKALGKARLNNLFWMHGPIFHVEAKADEAFSLLLEKLDTVASIEHAKQLLASSTSGPLSEAMKIAALKHGYDLREWRTSIITLTDEKEMFDRIKHEARKNINKLQSDPKIKVHRIDSWDEKGQEYLKILKQTRKRLGERMPPHYPNEQFFSHLRASAGLVLVEKEGEIIGGMGVLFFNKTVVEVATAIGERALQEKDYVGDLIKWEIMRWAREKGMQQYDLMGFSPDPTSQKEEGIARFKRKFGGEDKTYYYLSKRYGGRK
jgi:hypothetical protein